ncbi:ankyrin repeat domain-containing protein [Limnoglobus roseus]|uniref:Uncharacterized protein n=1 Tax=Limnoglobus roseus TaxID=2598579 RepID=A0A5C1ANY9_9BACT|nr:ankyrin repeat domain-containing protein [Limnoglobus roseus]QEL18578.1 hypothetical protein PX52LOC_05610 [Limnoglobus roseus]
MTDGFSKTRYRVAQHWRYRNETPEASDILIILGVEDHPTQGIICNVNVEYVPPFAVGPSNFISGGWYWVTQDALDRSVLDLVAEKGPLPQSFGTTGDFRCGPEFWGRNTGPMAVDRTVCDLVREQTERYKSEREEYARQPPQEQPPAESLGLWSLIARSETARLCELVRQHPSIATDPLPRDESDEYCYSGEEYEGCTPLMLAAELGEVEAAKALLEFGADPNHRNAQGETALHFAGRASCRSDGPAKVALLLCEHGADATNAVGKTPMTCSYCSTDVAEVLIRFSAPPTLNHAVRLRMFDWARRELRNNPNAVRETVFPDELLDDIGHEIRNEAERRHGREVRLGRGEKPEDGEGEWPDMMACSSVMAFHLTDGSPADDDKLAVWRRHAEFERAVFEEFRDLLDMALAGGADANAGSTLFYAVTMLDTSLAELLLHNGADPNRDVKRGVATYMPDLARTRRMANLLRRHGAKENPYTKQVEPWEARMNLLTDRLKEEFD